MAIDESKIVDAVVGMNPHGNEEGIIDAFGVYLTNHFTDYYNQISYTFEQEVKRLNKDDLPLLIELLKSCGLNEKNICVKLNDRRLTDSILERFDVKQENKQDIMRIIDKRDKLPQKVFLETLGDYFAKPKDFIAFLD